MRLHTDGTNVVLLTPKSRTHWRESGRNTIEVIPENSAVTDCDRSGLMCITPKGERDFSARLVAAGALAADAIDEETVAAIMLGEDSTFLVQGPLNTGGDWPKIIDVGAVDPIRVAWPVGLIWNKNDKSLFDLAKTHGDGILDSFVPTLECNEYGIAIASCGSGAVVLVRPGSDTVSASFQLPANEDTALYACPTQRGVLVSMIVDGQDSAYLHIAEDGTVLGHREAQCATPALLLDSGFLIYDRRNGRVALVSQKFTEKTSIPLSWVPVDSASASDGASFALAGTEQMLRGHVDVKGNLVVVDTYGEIKQAGAKRPGELAALEAKWDPERSRGKSAVGFAAAMKPAPWSALVDQPFELLMHARSTGGIGKGIRVVLAGDAANTCQIEAVSVDGQRQEMVADGRGSFSATFPDIPLVQGLVYPFNPKPKNDAQKHAAAMLLEETHLELRVFGVAREVGAELLSVRISPLHKDSPPLKWMRPLVVQVDAPG